ncbi:transposase [Candidatus Poribacteria bacterium]|nr:transposase [Candidatus Poribacteria bacterium]
MSYTYNLHLMRLIDEQYTKTPFYGVPRMTAYLRSKRVERLMREMALEGMKIVRPDEVWCSDITYNGLV